MILFLDDSDERIRIFKARFPDAQIVRTASEAIDALASNADFVWESVWLDHDLGGHHFQDSADPESGFEVVRWIISKQPTIVDIYVHSWNPVAAALMVTELIGAGYNVHRWPFDSTLLFAGEDS